MFTRLAVHLFRYRLLLVVALSATAAPAAELTWTGVAASPNNQWMMGGNWTPVGPPVAGDTARFGNTVNTAIVEAVSTNTAGATAGVVTFQDVGLASYTISGSTRLALNNNAADAQINHFGGGSAAANQSITSGIDFTNNLVITNDGQFGLTSLTISGTTVSINATGGVGRGVSVGGGGNTTLSTPIAVGVTGGVTKNGSGVLTLSSTTSAFTGGITINDGVLSVSATTHLGALANNITFGGTGTGVFRSTASTTFTIARNFSLVNAPGMLLNDGTGPLTITGILSGANPLAIFGDPTGVALQGANAGYTGAVTVGGPTRLVGSTLYNRPFTSSNDVGLILSGAAGSLSAAQSVTVNNGALLQITQSAPALTGRLAGVPLTFHSGRFAYSSAGTTAIADTLGSLTVTGNNIITGVAVAGPAAGTSVTFGPLTRNDNATFFFRSVITAANGQIGGTPSALTVNYFMGGVSDPGGTGTSRGVIPWASHITTVTGTDPVNLMTYDANGFRPLNTTTETNNVTASVTLGPADAGTNVRLAPTAAATVTVPSGGLSINSLSNASSSTVTIQANSSADVLTIASGGVAALTNLTFNNVTFGAGANPLYLHSGATFNVQGTSSITGTGGVAVSAISSTSTYRLNLTNTVANTFRGGLYLNGTAQVGFTANNQLGDEVAAGDLAGDIVLGGGQLLFTNLTTDATLSAGRTITVGPANGTIGTTEPGRTLTISGLITGPGQMQFGGGASLDAAGVVSLTNPSANNYSGGTIIDTGILAIARGDLLGSGPIFFNAGTLRADNTLTLLAPVWFEADSTIDTGANIVTLSGPVDGSVSTDDLIKTGTGTLAINATGRFRGALTVNGGTVRIGGLAGSVQTRDYNLNPGSLVEVNFLAGGTSLNRVSDASTVSLNGGTFRLFGNTATGVSELAGALELLNTGVAEVLAPGAVDSILAFTGATGTGTVHFRGTNLGRAAAAPAGLVRITNLTRNQIVPYATAENLSNPGVIDQAYYDIGPDMVLGTPDDRGVRVVNVVTDFVTGSVIDNASNNPPATPPADFRVTTATTTVGASNVVNSLRFVPGQSLTMDAGETLTLSSGTVWVEPGAGTSQITGGGTLAAGTVPARFITNGDIAVSTGLTGTGGLNKSGAGTLTLSGTYGITGSIAANAGTLALNTNVSATTLTGGGTVQIGTGNTLTLTSGSSQTVAATLTGGGGLVYNPTSAVTLTLTGNNSYAGGTTSNANARYNIQTSTAFGTGPVTLANTSSATVLTFNSPTVPLTVANNIGLSTTSTIISTFSNTGTTSTTLSGVISGGNGTAAVNTRLLFGGTTTGTFALTNINNSFTVGDGTTGGVELDAGTFQVAHNGVLGAATNQLILDISSTTTQGLQFTAPNVDLSRPVLLTLNTRVDTNGFNATFSGQVRGTTTTSAIIKVGAGTLTLSNATNTIVSPFTVNGGRLQVSGVLPASTGLVAVNSGGTLGGTGNVSRPITVAAGGAIAPGASIGTLTVGNASAVTWLPGGNYELEHNVAAVNPTTPGTDNDFISSAGGLNLASLGTGVGQQFNLVLVPTNVGPGTTPVTYTIGTFAGGVTLPAGFTGPDLTPLFSFSGAFNSAPAVMLTGNSVQATFTPVPEPVGILAACAIAAGLVRRYRRRAK